MSSRNILSYQYVPLFFEDKGNLIMNLDGMKLLTEYERQFKRKYPGHSCGLDPTVVGENGYALTFQVLDNKILYSFILEVGGMKKGDYVCTLYFLRGGLSECKDLYWLKYTLRSEHFLESRKPMEMNIDNAINVARLMIQRYSEEKKEEV